MSQVVYQGNSLDLLAHLPDASVDAVVTDPPYGLSNPDQVKSAIDRVCKVFRHRSLPDLYEWDLQAEQETPLPSVRDHSAPLRGMYGPVGVDNGVGVPESSVDLHGHAADHEVDARPEAPRPRVTHGDLPLEGNTPPSQFLGDFIFDARHGAQVGSDVLRGGLPELFLGGFSVPIVAAFPSGLPGEGTAGRAHGGAYGTHDVWPGADPLGQSSGPPGVVAGARAVMRAVLRFDTAGSPRELGPAPSAGEELYGDTARPNLVRARSGASRLSTVAKPFRVRLVGDLANGADAFFHLWLPFKLPVAKLPRGGFMGKDWDAALPDPRTWSECLRVLKPGGHLVAFGAPRIYHRLACQIEDAGFELRDCLLWLFGSGFPKSLDVSKAIDRTRDDTAEMRVVCRFLRSAMERAGMSSANVAEHFGVHSRMVDHWAARDTDSQPTTPTIDQWVALCAVIGFEGGPEIDALVWRLNGRKGTPGEAWLQREVIERKRNSKGNFATDFLSGVADEYNITAPATPAAARWSGYGTALKPAYEPIALARKPLDGTVAANVLKWGTGAINVDGCRIASDELTGRGGGGSALHEGGLSREGGAARPVLGRWPANIILDEEAGAALDEQTAGLSGRGNKSPSKRGEYNATSYGVGAGGDCGGALNYGGASRFFYCPKASRSERESGLGHLPPRVIDPSRGDDAAGRDSPRTGTGRSGDGRRNHHPTVKPVELMRWLIRLVCPPGGVVLEPFAGSGSTLVAAALEDRDAIGMELDPEFVAIAAARVARAQKLAFAEETRMEQTSMDLGGES